ncbi:unnamed protein product [Caenorhabditis sp. 36 PRJEB53466]|nr:unnamed protein product [Caenorhabditis sp. 36 PRJEB53466]
MTESLGHHHLADDMNVETYMEVRPHQPRYLCPYGCNKLIASRTIDYHKNNGCGRRLNDTVTAHPELKKRFYCCGACLAEFVTRSEFHAHLRVEHDVHPEVNTMQFADRAAFERFRNWLESEGGAHFRHKSGAKRRGRGKGIFLACNRSGYVSSDKNAPLDRTGPFRLGYTCTAYIHATEHADGHVSAEVCGDHYGHDARMRLPNVIKYLVAQKQLEGCPSMEILGYLRHHFHRFAGESIFANRVCFIDMEELKTIYMSCTKKWQKEGIPKIVEIWEEELLDKVGIVWPIPSPNSSPVYHQHHHQMHNLHHHQNRIRKPTTSEIALQEGWPRPRVFTAKVRGENGVMVPFDIGGTTGGVPDAQYAQEEMEDPSYIDMEMDEYEEEAYVQDGQMVVDEGEEVVEEYHQNHRQEMGNSQIIENDEIEVEVESEVVVSSVEDENIVIEEEQEKISGEHVVLESPTNEIVIVDGDEEDEEEEGVVEEERIHLNHLNHLNVHHHHLGHHQHFQKEEEHGQSSSSQIGEPRYIEAAKVEQIEQIMEEIEAFKITILKRADQISPGNLKSLLIRFQTLHQSVMEKDSSQPAATSLTVFPNRAKYLYRPGKGLEKPESEYLSGRCGDVTLQPIEDEISDDEELMTSSLTVLPFNSCIWS